MSFSRRGLLGAAGALGLGRLAWAIERAGGLPHHPPRARRVVWLFQAGGPSQLDLFDAKPTLSARAGEPIPPSVLGGQRLTAMTAMSPQNAQPSPFGFDRHGQSGAELSELLPHTAAIADRLCFLKAVYTDAINHDPAMALMHTGSQQAGRPSAGAWVSHGLGALTADVPAFAVLINRNTIPDPQPLYGRLWGAGFLSSRHQGLRLRSGSDPVPYLSDGTGMSAAATQRLLSRREALDRVHLAQSGDPEVESRIAAYQLAADMQRSMPALTAVTREPASTFQLYGEEARVPGTHAHNCLLARRLLEGGVRYVQVYHRDWDQHFDLPGRLRRVAAEDDRASAALVSDLAQRGLLEDTLVVWGGEFGRTAYGQGAGAVFGRDHHPRCFTVWLAGGGVKAGLTHGATDDYGYNVVQGAVHVHDLHATLLHLLGIDHRRFTVRHLGRDFRLTDVAGQVVAPILA